MIGLLFYSGDSSGALRAGGIGSWPLQVGCPLVGGALLGLWALCKGK